MCYAGDKKLLAGILRSTVKLKQQTFFLHRCDFDEAKKKYNEKLTHRNSAETENKKALKL